MPAAEDRCPVDSGIPDCRTGLAGRLRFVVSELRDVWRELSTHAHREPGSREATAHNDGPDLSKQRSE